MLLNLNYCFKIPCFNNKKSLSKTSEHSLIIGSVIIWKYPQNTTQKMLVVQLLSHTIAYKCGRSVPSLTQQHEKGGWVLLLQFSH